MSVFISNYDAAPGYWEVTHDDAPGGAHSGQVVETDIKHALGIDGSPNFAAISVTCPVCQSVSTHPVGGGSHPAQVQEMFVRIAERDGCPCSAPLAAGRSQSETATHVKAHVEEMDGEGRWALG